MRTSLWTKYPFSSRLAVWVVLPAALLAGAASLILFSSMAQVSGEIHVPGLGKSVTIHRDAYSVPEIQANTDRDAYFALGFVHAQDRLWQMEMNRRIGAGRLSEVLGETSLAGDIAIRRIGLLHNARKIWGALDEQSRDVLQAYVDGVNAGINKLPVLPLEYHLKGFKPEPWRPEDSLVLMQLMAWEYSNNYGSEIDRLLLVRHYGVDVAKAIMPGMPADLDKVLVQQTRDLQRSAAISPLQGVFGSRIASIGSNGWVVAGSKTASGLPVLSNDPHLGTPIPSLWYLATIAGKQLNVSGATMPGLPFVLIGRNRNIAWGMTNAYADTQDVIIEDINPLNKNQYKYDGAYVDMQITREEIRVKSDFLRPSHPPERIVVRRTRNGPLVSDISDPLGKVSFSVKWTGDADAGGTFRSFVRLNYANDWKEFNEALSGFVAPIHNFLYADRRGNIGSLAPGVYPIRTVGNGSIPVSSVHASHLWRGAIPYENVPRIFNPSEGYIVSANQKFVADNYPYHISTDWQPAYRADRIRTELERLIAASKGRLTVAQMSHLQLDVMTPAASNGVLRRMQELQPRQEAQTGPLALIKSWDGNMAVNSSAATIYASWTSHLNVVLLEKLKKTHARPSEGGDPLSRMKYSDNAELLERVLLSDQQGWCQLFDGDGSCRSLLYASLDRAINELTRTLGGNVDKWTWERVHRTEFAHFPFSKPWLSPGLPAAEESLVSTLFDRSVPTPGGNDTVNNGPLSFGKKTKYAQFSGAMYRQNIDFGKNQDAVFMQGTGQSGNPVSPHYDDMIEPFIQGRYLPMQDRPVAQTLQLIPATRKED